MSTENPAKIPNDFYPEGFAEWLQPLWEARQRFVAGWSDAERSLCLAIIRSFTDSGRGPDLAEIVERSGLGEAEAVAILERFNKRDVLVYDSAAQRIRAFYPFSDVPCCHHITFPSGRRQFGM